MVESIYGWLVTLPPATLYAVLSGAGLVENFFPPFPSDLIVAFGSFLVAQNERGSLALLALYTWLGNVSGAMLMYALGRRFGAERLEQRLAGARARSWDTRIHQMFDRYGMPAIFVSRFVPGLRALVPVVAGAARYPVLQTTLMIAIASAIWYGSITYIAYRVGSNLDALNEAVGRYSATAGIVGAAILVVAAAIWYVRRRRRTPR